MKFTLDEQVKLITLLDHDLELSKLHLLESVHDDESEEHKKIYRIEIKLARNLIQKVTENGKQ